MDGLLIRKAVAADADAVAGIACVCWEPIYDLYRKELGEELYRLAYPEALPRKAARVRDAVMEDRCFVAEVEGSVCGFAAFSRDGAMGFLNENAVLPEYKGRGIAGSLYREIMDLLKARGCQAVSVSTGLDEAHGPARAAYEKAGFTLGLPSIRYYKAL